MTEGIYFWVRDLVFYFILVSTVMNLLPDQNYKKYVRFFLGIMLIVLILKPVLGWLDLEDTLQEQYIQESLETQWEEIEGQISIEQERDG